MAERQTTDGIGPTKATAASAACWPTMLQVSVALAEAMGAHCTHALPREAVALLLGDRRGRTLRVTRLLPLANIADGADAFACPPWEFAQAAAAAALRHESILGFLHSHPAAPPRPSASDRAQLWRDCVHVIFGRRGAGAGWWPGAFFVTGSGDYLPLRWTTTETHP